MAPASRAEKVEVKRMLSDRKGAIILDAQRRIQLVTPVAENLLGWENDQVADMACPLIFDCRDAQGELMCERCSFADALQRQEISKPKPLFMADAFGGRRRVMMSFWYLPPAGYIYHPRVLALLNEVSTPPASEDTR
jgi:hypothetical protein